MIEGASASTARALTAEAVAAAQGIARTYPGHATAFATADELKSLVEYAQAALNGDALLSGLEL